jgi:hypothetical protein
VRRLAAIVAAGVLAAGSAGQTLDLAAPPTLPALPEDNAVTRMARTVQEEIRSLEAELTDAEGREATVLSARIALRTMAFDLLARGGVEPLERSSAAMEGLRLADLRRSLDVALAREFSGDASPRPLRSRDRIVRGLERFAEIAPRAMAAPGLGETGPLDAAIATSLRPLVDAMAVMSGLEGGESLGTGWPAIGSRAVEDGPDAALPTGLPGVDAAFAKPESAAVAGRAEALSLARSIAACPWLATEDRAAADAELTGLAAGASDAEVRLVRARGGLAAIAASLGDEGRRSLERLDPAVSETVVRALRSDAEDRERLGVDRLARAIARMREPLTLAASTDRLADGLPRDLRIAGRPLVDRTSRADRAALAVFPALLDRADALVDPATTGPLIAQRDAHADLRRLADVERLSRSIGGVRPQAAEPLRRRLSRAMRDLSDPGRRERAAAGFDALEDQVDRFLTLPFEAELRRETPAAIDLSAGQPARLVAEIDLARSLWADAWAEGRSSGPEASRLHDLWRLARAMQVVASSSGTDRAEAGRLSCWGGFHATRSTLGPALVDTTAQVRLAANAMLAEGGREQLAKSLAAIERDLPISLLAGALRSRLSPWLDDRPDPPLGLLAATREPPEPDAFGLAFRADLSAIARGVRELEELRRDGRTAEAVTLHASISALAARVLAGLGEDAGSPLPALPDLPEEDATSKSPRGRP